jgi:hypothetical protein
MADIRSGYVRVVVHKSFHSISCGCAAGSFIEGERGRQRTVGVDLLLKRGNHLLGGADGVCACNETAGQDVLACQCH